MTELEKLKNYLDDHGFDARWSYVNDENDQVVVYLDNRRMWDAVCHRWSYGGDRGLLEIYGSICNDVIGWLTADDVIKILEWQAKNNRKWTSIDTMDDIEEGN